MQNNSAIYELINEKKMMLAQEITGLQFQQYPELEIKYGKAGKDKCLEDAQYHLTYLAESIRANSKPIFTAYIEWAKTMLEAREIPFQDLINNLGLMELVCRRILPPQHSAIVTEYIQLVLMPSESIEPTPSTFLTAINPLLQEATTYLSLLLEGNRSEAQALVSGLVQNGQPVAAIYEHIFQPSQYEVGRLWQTNQITVAHEHYCTAATQLIMATLYPYIFKTEKNGCKMLACTVSGDLHEMGIRMVADYFELDGWDTYYMGASMPEANILTAIMEQKAQLLAISATMPFHISKVEAIIKKVRSRVENNRVKIIVGGYPFALEPDLWKRTGADGYAVNAREAIALANKLINLN